MIFMPVPCNILPGPVYTSVLEIEEFDLVPAGEWSIPAYDKFGGQGAYRRPVSSRCGVRPFLSYGQAQCQFIYTLWLFSKNAIQSASILHKL